MCSLLTLTVVGWVLAVNLAAAAFMTGLIWFVQVVHYPLLASVPNEISAGTSLQHQRLTGRVVGPVMAVEFATALHLVLSPPRGLGPWWPSAAFAFLAIALATTVFYSVPLHARMANGQDLVASKRLINSNWIRTAAWSSRTIVVVIMAARAR